MASVVRVPWSPLVAGDVELDEPASRYLCRVHRLDAGAAFELFDVSAGLEARACVLRADGKRARVRVEVPSPARNRPRRPVTLLQGMGRGDRFDDVVRDATALAATRIVPLLSEHTVVRLDGARAAARRERLVQLAVDAARQSERGDIPQVELPLPLLDALEALPRWQPAGLRLLLEPRCSTPLATALSGIAGTDGVTLLIGPEGGFSDAEVALAETHAFVRVQLGALVLRTELATAAALGALAAWA